MHSHHSHSGDYSAHGVDPLNAIVNQAEKMKFHTYCLTEHMPRIDSKFLYPEEVDNDITDVEALKVLQSKFRDFLVHSKEIKQAHSNEKPHIIIGTEIEACNFEHIKYAKDVLNDNKNIIKFCVGSIHHINQIPIDIDQQNWNKALKSFDNNIKNMLLSYFEAQYVMIKNLQPLVIGHFDLFKLFLPSDLEVDPNTGYCNFDKNNDQKLVSLNDVSYIDLWDDIKNLMIRNLKYIESYGGVIEINTSALRKGLKEPYPSKQVVDLVKQYCGARFVLSDDAHAVSHVGVCYLEALAYIRDSLQLDKMFYLHQEDEAVIVKSISIDQFIANEFWSSLKQQNCHILADQ